MLNSVRKHPQYPDRKPNSAGYGFSLSGQLIARSLESTTLDLSGAPSGVVLIQVWTQGEVITRKLILH